tara:strand:- start:34 stop:879 length:846 start_codon:yes stop_codon:yes gene_type:complete
MKKANPEYSIHELCSLFQLSERTYYAQIRPKVINNEQLKLMSAIKAISAETGATYGRRRMRAALVLRGFKLGIHRTVSLMKQAKVRAIRPSRKHYYPNTGKAHFLALNLLDRQFNPEQANRYWVGDITYIRTHQGWSYLACVLDLATKEIVGWAMSTSPNAALAKAALSHAIRRQKPELLKLMFHSDQGVQYSANIFVKYLATLKVTQSMSRRGNCWDNSVMERFFRSLKSERLNHVKFIHHDAAARTIESYIYFYNYKRLHSSLGYITPVQKMAELQKAA